MLQNPHVLLTFGKVQNPLRLPPTTTSEHPQVVRTCGGFKDFDLEMCFAPQGRALFEHVIFQVFSTWCVLYRVSTFVRFWCVH